MDKSACDDLVMGIDLGTTNSCVALFLNNKVIIVKNDSDEKLTPSFVFFQDYDKVIVGEHGKGMANVKPYRGIYEIKRFVGRNMDDIKNILENLVFEVEADSENNPLVVIKNNKQILKQTPEEICSLILKQLKKDVETKYDKIDKAVITVPAYFNVTQRKVTLAAAKEAGFTVLKLLSEPTAAALSYYYEFGGDDDNNYCLVYDLGGGTFDVAILKRTENDIIVISVDGDTQLGGRDFDDLIVNYVCNELIEKYNFNPKTDKTLLRRIWNQCETAKKNLCSEKHVDICLRCVVPNKHSVEITLSREQFETMANDLFKRTIDIVDSCVKNSKVPKNSIEEIILAGGSSRIPKIQQLVSDYFDGKELNQLVNPDECVAEGAALQAAILSTHPIQEIRTIKLTDVVPLSLGIVDVVGRMIFMIKNNSPIPTSVSKLYKTVKDNQKSINIKIYEGERLQAKKNSLLGKFEITNLTPAPPGQCTIVVSMEVDENNILTVTAKETNKENVKQLTVDFIKGSKNEEEIKDFIENANKNGEEDQRFMKFANYKSYFIKYLIAVIHNLEKKKLVEKHNDIYEICIQLQSEVRFLNNDNIVDTVKETEIQCRSVVKRYNFTGMPDLLEEEFPNHKIRDKSENPKNL